MYNKWFLIWHQFLSSLSESFILINFPSDRHTDTLNPLLTSSKQSLLLVEALPESWARSKLVFWVCTGIVIIPDLGSHGIQYVRIVRIIIIPGIPQGRRTNSGSWDPNGIPYESFLQDARIRNNNRGHFLQNSIDSGDKSIGGFII